MRVNDPSITGASTSQTTGPDKAHGAETVAGGRSAAAKRRENTTDHVSLSDLSARLRAAEIESPERTSRLEQLALEVRQGRYQLDSAATSRRLVDDHISE